MRACRRRRDGGRGRLSVDVDRAGEGCRLRETYRSEEVAALVVVLDLQWQELVVVFVVVLVSGEFDGENIPAGARAGQRHARKRARGRGRGHESSSYWRGVTG